MTPGEFDDRLDHLEARAGGLFELGAALCVDRAAQEARPRGEQLGQPLARRGDDDRVPGSQRDVVEGRQEHALAPLDQPDGDVGQIGKEPRDGLGSHQRMACRLSWGETGSLP